MFGLDTLQTSGIYEGVPIGYLQRINRNFFRARKNTPSSRHWALLEENPQPHIVYVSETITSQPLHPITIMVTSYDPQFNQDLTKKISQRLDIELTPNSQFHRGRRLVQQIMFKCAEMKGFQDYVELIRMVEENSRQ